MFKLNIINTESQKKKSIVPQLIHNIELVYLMTVLQIKEIWIQKLKLTYKLNNRIIRLIKQMEENNRFGDNITKLLFKYENRIFHIKFDIIHI